MSSMIFGDRRRNNGGGGASNFRQSDRESKGFNNKIDEHDRSSSTENKISRETSPKGQKQAAPALAQRSRALQAEKRVFNWRLCLSPLVRAKPNEYLVHNHGRTVQETGASMGGGARKLDLSRRRSLAAVDGRSLPISEESLTTVDFF
ncbi:hypothetical protein AHAS_Ahas14G0247000 [Arachis hypogaea]